METKIYNGDKHILGRLSTVIAKELLNGERVVLYNAEKLFITGNRKNILDKYIKRRSKKSHQNPEHSPKWPRRPDLLVRRIIRGMLPYKKARGKKCFKKLRVCMGEPDKIIKQLKNQNMTIKSALAKPGNKGISISELCKSLGYTSKY